MTLIGGSFAVTVTAVLVLGAPPAALAQSVPGTDIVTDTTGTIDTTTGTVTDTVDTTTGTVTDTVDTTTGTIDDSTGGAVSDTTKTVTDATGGTGSGSTTGTIEDLLDGGSGSTPTLNDLTSNVINDIVDQGAAKGLSPAAAEGWIEGKKMADLANADRAAAALVSLSLLIEDLASIIAEAGSGSSTGAEIQLSSDSYSPFAEAGRVAVAAAKALAFPLALALLVVAFLTVQGRIGRKDPKLVLAPVDGAQDSLTFE